MCNSDHYSDLQKRFDAYCKKVLRNAARNINKKKKRIHDNETAFSSLDNSIVQEISSTDDYFKSDHIFEVENIEIVVSGDLVAQALRLLSDINRNIILLSYYLCMSDNQISQLLNLSRSKIQRCRINSLNSLRIYLEKVGYTSYE